MAHPSPPGDGLPTTRTVPVVPVSPTPTLAPPVDRRARRRAADAAMTARVHRAVARIPTVRTGACVALGLLGSCLGAASAFVGGNGRRVPWPAAGLRDLWPAHGDAAAQLVGVLGIALVVVTWLALGVGVLRRRVSLRGVLGFAAAATVPLALAPPLFSEDAWTYVAIGQLVDRGFDPYRVGWGVLGRGDYTANLSVFWRDSPSPYSPGALRLLQGVAHAVGGSLGGGVVVLRLLTLAALAVCVPLLVTLTAARLVPRAPVVWLVMANPLLIVTFVSALHLDVLVLPLLLAALVAQQRRHDVLAVLAASLAGQVKVTALVVAGFVVAARLLTDRDGEPRDRRVRAAAGLAALAAAVFVGVNLLCGLGFGWVSALGIPGRANNVLTPLDAATDLVSVVGIGPGPLPGQVVSTAPGWLTVLGLSIGAVATVLLALRVERLGVARGAAYSLILLTLLNGAVWSWYFCVPFVLLALFGSRREQLVVVGLSTLLVFSIRPDGASGGGGGFRAAALAGDVFFLAVYAVAARVVVHRPAPAVAVAGALPEPAGAPAGAPVAEPARASARLPDGPSR